MWLVTWEAIHTGKWVSEPDSFGTEREALSYMEGASAALLDSNCVVLYKCERVASIPPADRLPGGGQ